MTIIVSASEQLHRAASVTQCHGRGLLLEHLTLVGLPKSRNQKDADMLLGQAMKNLRLGLVGGRLPSVSLAIEDGVKYQWQRLVKDSSSWKSVWETAWECFEATIQALSTSELPIEFLDAFNGVTCCSLSLDRLAMIRDLNLPASLRRLKRLSINLSQHVVNEEEAEEMQAFTTGERNTEAICEFLQHCSSVLEDLHLHWYKLRTINLSNSISEEKQFFDRVAQPCRFPFHKRCTLKGIETSEARLLSFLCYLQQLHSIDMEEIHIRTGSLRSVFAYLGQLDYLHLNALWEKKMIHLMHLGSHIFLVPTDQRDQILLRGRELMHEFLLNIVMGGAL